MGSTSIHVSLKAGEHGDFATITFADDGIGFIEKAGSRRHGLGLVRRLMEQVKGSAELNTDHGTAWSLQFPVVRAPTIEAPVI